VGFFRVRLAEEDRLWVGEVDDRHLRGYLAVVADPPEGGARRFRVVTVVHYNNWLGPVYFNAIRPFHHLIVGAMARAGARAARPVHSLA
jgi:hypothetical protein